MSFSAHLFDRVLNPRRSCGALTEAIRSRYTALAEESGGGRTATTLRWSAKARFSTCWRRAANGRLCPKICRPRARHVPNLCCGIGAGRWNVFTTHFMSPYANPPARTPADDGDYLMPERQGRSKRSASIDPQELDAGKKVTWRKAPYPRR
jgi:hypothetical protein